MLRQVVLNKQIEMLRSKRSELEEKKEELEAARQELDELEQKLEEALDEVTEETPQEDKDVLDGEVEEATQKDEALAKEEDANAEALTQVEEEIKKLEEELEEIAARAARSAKKTQHKEERKVKTIMNTRKFFGMDHQERDAFFAREDVQKFCADLRAMGKRAAVSNANLLIPDVVLGVMGNLLPTQSKMYKHVNVQRIPGTARVIIAGDSPEGVWTEMCANTNEVEIGFNAVEIDGYMISAAIFVCNAILQDADNIDLASHVITELTKGLAKGLDKAILYGTGDHMPLGIVTRLAQETKPSGYPANAREWKDLHTTNLVSISGKEGIKLYQAIVEASGAVENDYADGDTVWIMNNKTRTKLISAAMNFNAAGAVVAGIDATMPVLGGAIETLKFVPDDVIIMGYGQTYLLGEREGVTVDESKHYKWMANQTGYKALARYDGVPVIPEAWMAIGIGGVVPNATDVTFPADEANT